MRVTASSAAHCSRWRRERRSGRSCSGCSCAENMGRPLKNGISKSTTWRLTAENLNLRPIFFERVDGGDGASRCWWWMGPTNGRYGVFCRGMGREYAHRFAWILHHRRNIPDGAVVCHSCDEPLCVNPAHLWLGTHLDNVRDAIAKGRNSQAPHFFGIDHHWGGRTHCSKGHEFSQANTKHRSDSPGARRCLRCQRDRTERRRLMRQSARRTDP